MRRSRRDWGVRFDASGAMIRSVGIDLTQARLELEQDGYTVLRGEIDAPALEAEVDHALSEGCQDPEMLRFASGDGTVTLRYVPMTCDATPLSLDLVDRFAVVASGLLGRPVLAGRAKGTLYSGDTGWHRDSDLAIPTLGFLAYLEPLDSASGALVVRPGSHRALRSGAPPARAPVVLATEPGDVVVFDEHLFHGSSGGGPARRQWRADFIADPATLEESAAARSWFSTTMCDGLDHGYDGQCYPSYGPAWQRRHPDWAERMAMLGVPI